MITAAHDVLAAALALPPTERAEIARQLLDSLAGLPGMDIDDPACLQEIERRVSEVEEGAVALLDWREAIRDLRHANANRKSST